MLDKWIDLADSLRFANKKPSKIKFLLFLDNIIRKYFSLYILINNQLI